MKLLGILMVFLQISCIPKQLSDGGGTDLASLVKAGKNVHFDNSVFNEEISFTSYLLENLISESVYNVKINSSITFTNCTFNGPVTAFTSKDENKAILSTFVGNLSFINCEFKDVVNFKGISINGRADFTKSTFHKEANFEEATFFQNAYFNSTSFFEDLRFQNSNFHQKANFMHAEFRGNMSFQNSVFNGECQMGAIKSLAYADFSLLDCRGNSFFNYAEFHDRADFTNCHFQRSFFFVKTSVIHIDFENSLFMGNTKFDKVDDIKQYNLQSCFFLHGAPSSIQE